MSSAITQTYGRYEERVLTEANSSGVTSGVLITWPAGPDNTPTGYPAGGENDHYETTAATNDRSEFHTIVYLPGTANASPILTHKASTSDWRTVAMEWTPEEIRIFVDGEDAGVITDPEGIPDVAHKTAIRLDAMNKGDMGSNEINMYVEYIRSYEKIC